MGYQVDASGNQILASPQWVLGQSAFLRTDNGTAVMNVNGTAAGTPEVVWNGDGTYWTGGDQGSAETYAAHSGTYGWDSSPTLQGQDSEFDYGSNRDITAFDTLAFWMQPKAFPVGSDLQVLWKTAAGTTKGNVLSVADYVTNMDLNVWQRVEIPIADFGLPEDVAKVHFKYALKGGQQFWFDDIELNTGGGGGPFTFQVAAPANTLYHVSMAVLIIAAPGAGWDANSFADISGGIANGLLFRHRRLSDSSVLWSLNSKDNMDLFGRYHPQDDITFSGGDLLVGFMVKPGLASITITDDEALEWVVRDNLSTLSSMRAFVHYGKEVL
jgi:hypothetical protein